VDFIEIDRDFETDVAIPKWAPASDKIAYLRLTTRTSIPYDLIVRTLDGSREPKVAELPSINVDSFAWRPRP